MDTTRWLIRLTNEVRSSRGGRRAGPGADRHSHRAGGPGRGAYTGLAVHRAARICAVAGGGQVLVSQATQMLIEDEEEGEPGFTLVEVGEYRLKGPGPAGAVVPAGRAPAGSTRPPRRAEGGRSGTRAGRRRWCVGCRRR
jgi:class 3 adenylate cyclase